MGYLPYSLFFFLHPDFWQLVFVTGTERTMVFVETKRQADFIATYLCQENVPTTSIHGFVTCPGILSFYLLYFNPESNW